MDSAHRRKLFTFLIETGIKLEAKNTTVCTAAILTYRTLRKQASRELCAHTIAAASFLLAAKVEEDQAVKSRDVVNIAYSVLHGSPPVATSDESRKLRASICRMEYIILRLLKFNISVDNPHKYLLHYASSLLHWYTHELASSHVIALSFILLRDAHVDPGWVLSHSPQTIAIVCLMVALRASKIPLKVHWYEVFSDSLTRSKLENLEEEFFHSVLRRQ